MRLTQNPEKHGKGQMDAKGGYWDSSWLNVGCDQCVLLCFDVSFAGECGIAVARNFHLLFCACCCCGLFLHVLALHSFSHRLPHCFAIFKDLFIDLLRGAPARREPELCCARDALS